MARFRTGLSRVRGIAAGGGQIALAGDKAIAIHRADGAPVRSIALGDAPAALAVAADGTLYAAMKDHVEVYSAAGKLKTRWQTPARRSWLTSVAVTQERVWVGDAGQRLVLGYDLTGRKVAVRGKTPGLLAPSPHLDVAVGRDGILWIGNPGRHRLEAYAPDGTLKRWWGKASNDLAGFCGCCNPTDFALLPDGGFVTAEKGLLRVKVYDAAGRFRGLVAGPETFAESRAGLDLAVDDRGRVLVLDRGSGITRIYEKGQADGR